jgi:hypothetical protein
LAQFIASGGRYIAITSVDIPEHLLGHHATSGAPVTCGVIRNSPDCDTLACHCGGFNQLVKKHRISTPISDDMIWSWSGSIIIDVHLDFRNIVWKWHRRKKILDSHIVIEYERYLDDVTSFFKTQFVEVK